MKALNCAALLGLACVTCACQVHQSAAMIVDKKTVLMASVQNAPQGSRAGFSASSSGSNTTLHRVLQSADGRELFAYDAEVHPGTEPNLYGVTLKPVKGSPTFATVREASARRDSEEIMVELLEDAKSHRKVVDVLWLQTPQESLGDHVIRVHNQFYRWVHGR
jgi:hypothetical protein